MVLGARLGVYGWGRWRKIIGVGTSYFDNFGNFLLFHVMIIMSPTTKGVHPYVFSIWLFTPNYTPVTPLPGATIENSFKLKLKLMRRFARRSTDLVNEGYGYVTISHYSVMFEQRDVLWFYYEVKISKGDARLDHTNFITRLPMPAPVSVLL